MEINTNSLVEQEETRGSPDFGAKYRDLIS